MKNNKKVFLILSIIFLFFVLFMYFCFTIERVTETGGFHYIDYIIYGIIVVFILGLTIYLDMLVIKEKHDFIIEQENTLKENVKNRLEATYKIRNFKNEEEEDYTKEDVEIFAAYDLKVELPKVYVEPYGIQYDYILKMERENKEIIFGGNEEVLVEYEYRNRYKIYHINFAIFKEIENEKRLHIKTKEHISSKNEVFEEVFEDLEKNVKDVDDKYKSEYEVYYNKEYKNEKSEYIKLTDSQKELLLELYKQSKLNFTVVLDNGLLRIYVNLNGYLQDYTKMDKNLVSEQISNIFIKLIEEFK